MKYLIILILVFGFSVDIMAQSRSQKKQEKREAREVEFKEAKALLESKSFRFVAEWANTQKGRRINLSSNPNAYIQKGDTINANLPYFGVAQVATMSGEVGINIENETVQREKTKVNEKKLRLTYSFSVKSTRGEVLNCILTVHANKSADLSIRSTQRNMISYSGKLSALK